MTKDCFYFDVKAATAEFYQQCPAFQNNVAIIDSASMPLWTRQKLIETAVNKVVPDIEIQSGNLRSVFQHVISLEIKRQDAKMLRPHAALNLDFSIIISSPSCMEKAKFNKLLPGLNEASGPVKEALFQHFSHFTFDHEIGHLLDKDVQKRINAEETNIKESIADNYAALRHVQRFGADTSFLETWKHLRVMDTIIQSGMSHYTVHSLENTENWLTRNDVTGHPPEALIDIATKIAVESFNPERHHDLSIPLNPLYKKQPLEDEFCRHPYEVAGTRFLTNSQHMNSPHIPQIWQRWCAALGYDGLTEEQTKILLQHGQDSHGHMNSDLPSRKISGYSARHGLKR